MLLYILIIILSPFLFIYIFLTLQKHVQWKWLHYLSEKWDKWSYKRRRKSVTWIELLIFIIALGGFFMVLSIMKSPPPHMDSSIIVVADSCDWKCIGESLQASIEKVIRTPQKEKYFTVIPVKQASFIRYPKHRNLIIPVLTGNPGSPMISFLEKELFEKKKFSLKDLMDEPFVVLDNVWRKYQTVVFLFANDTQILKTRIDSLHDELYETFDTQYTRIQQLNLVQRKNEKERAQYLLNKYGWTFDNLGDLDIDIEEDHFVFIQSETSNRWLFIRWWDNLELENIDPGWMIKQRNHICDIHFDNIVVEDKYLYHKETRFLDFHALVTTGLWGDMDPVWGGPFKNFTFWDRSAKRIYMIDIAVYKAGKDKLPTLKMLEAMVYSFRIRGEM